MKYERVKICSETKRRSWVWTARIFVIDEYDNHYLCLEEVKNPAPPCDQKLRAGDNFEKANIFYLPSEVKNPHLATAEGIGIDEVIESVLIADQAGLFHKRSAFYLEKQSIQTNL